MKAYRPCETFGMIDQERFFNTVDELVEYYTPWCEENNIQLEYALSENNKVILSGINLNYLNELKDDGEDEEEADEQAMETLIIEDCTDAQINELKTETIG